MLYQLRIDPVKGEWNNITMQNGNYSVTSFEAIHLYLQEIHIKANAVRKFRKPHLKNICSTHVKRVEFE
jgi:hypothetical protein